MVSTGRRFVNWMELKSSPAAATADSVAEVLPPPPILAVDGHFKDRHGRVLALRGANVSGNVKIPTKPNGATHLTEGFYEMKEVSFVGRPFPLAEADEHFQRLHLWGLRFLRFLVTWEAIEHAGPGIYDDEYITYVFNILTVANKYGIIVHIDPHQDVWSRWTGGDGAPLWTLIKCGFDVKNFKDTNAAILHNHEHELKPQEYPKMIWPSNYFKLACSTMFTLFWGGDDFAPNFKIDGEGYGTMNEPSPGFIGHKDLNVCVSPIKKGHLPSPFQGMVLGSGRAVSVPFYDPFAVLHLVTGNPTDLRLVNTELKSAWRDAEGFGCIWQKAGVWAVNPRGEEPTLLRPDYFDTDKARAFGKQYYLPFAQKYAAALRGVAGPYQLMFVELPPSDFGQVEFPEITKAELPFAVNASHWYDGPTLFLGRFNHWFGVDTKTQAPILGAKKVTEHMFHELLAVKQRGVEKMQNAPSLVGEVGIPFNMHDGAAFASGDWSNCIAALDRSIQVMEANLLSFTLWNYCATNNNQTGDEWNLEDLSLFSRDQQRSPPNARNSNSARSPTVVRAASSPIPNHMNRDGKARADAAPALVPVSMPYDPSAGGRACEAFVRPYATKIAGTPITNVFHRQLRRFVLEFVDDPCVTADHPTEIFIPHAQFPNGFEVKVSDGYHRLLSDLSDDNATVHFYTLLYWHSQQRATATSERRFADDGKESKEGRGSSSAGQAFKAFVAPGSVSAFSNGTDPTSPKMLPPRKHQVIVMEGASGNPAARMARANSVPRPVTDKEADDGCNVS